jgi:hypothetical protein
LVDIAAYIFALAGALWYILSYLLMGIPEAIYKSELINRLYKTPTDSNKEFDA